MACEQKLSLILKLITVINKMVSMTHIHTHIIRRQIITIIISSD